MLFHLTSAYHTVWHCGLTCKFLSLLSDRYMISVITELVSKQSFTLAIGSGKRSRLRHLKNDVCSFSRPGTRTSASRKDLVPIIRAFAATEIKTPICASSSGTMEQYRSVNHHGNKVGGLQWEHGMVGKHLPITCIYCRHQYSTIGNVLSQTCMGQA